MERVLMWVPAEWVAAGMTGLPGTDVEVVSVDGETQLPASVTDPEPLPPSHELWTLPGVFITPHVAASTPVSMRRVVRLAREQAKANLRGDPLRNVITGTY